MVVGGYLVAFALASVAVAIRIASSGPDAQGGMHAFGDLVLFVAVFGTVGLVPTGLALVFLRPYRAFWLALAALGAVVAATGIAAVTLYTIGRTEVAPTILGSLAAISVLRILGTPLLAAALLLAAVASPQRGPRWTLLAACGIEIVMCVYVGIVWFGPLLFR